MKNIKHFAITLALPFVLTGCQKVIDVELNDSVQQYVIEGEINSGPGPYLVRVTKSKNFTEDNTFNQVAGAQVIITDRTTGTKDTLTRNTQGLYRTRRITGVRGHIYDLVVNVDGRKFESTSTMPQRAIQLDGLFTKKSALSERVYAVPVYRDPAGKGNYYRFRLWVNNVQVKVTWVDRDDISDGQVIENSLRYDPEDGPGNPKINKGDNVRVEMQCINQPVYDFFRTLSDIENADTATPTNPLTNIKGGALGVFSACTTSSLTVTSDIE